MEDLAKWPTFQKQYKEFTKIREQAHADYITSVYLIHMVLMH
jgi:hypothetical protein